MNRRLYQLAHSTWVCDYHLVWCPKYRGKVMAHSFIKQELKRMFKYIAKWKGLSIHAWHIGDEHIHLFISIPPKYSVAYVTQVLKGKTSMWIKKKVKYIPKGTFWARGYYSSTIGVNEHQIKNYIEKQHDHQTDATPRML